MILVSRSRLHTKHLRSIHISNQFQGLYRSFNANRLFQRPAIAWAFKNQYTNRPIKTSATSTATSNRISRRPGRLPDRTYLLPARLNMTPLQKRAAVFWTTIGFAATIRIGAYVECKSQTFVFTSENRQKLIKTLYQRLICLICP